MDSIKINDTSFLSFCKEYDIQLNSQQSQAVQTMDENILLLAVPGSGKTTVLVAKIGYLVIVKHIDPRNILAITFNTQATYEVKQRFAEKFGKDIANQISFKTINALSYQIYISFCKDRNKEIRKIDSLQTKSILRSIYQKVTGNYPGENEILDRETDITYVKNMRYSDEQIKTKNKNNEFYTIYQLYEKAMRKNGLMDFNDQMVFTIWILENMIPYRDMWNHKYQYIFVDEAQDTSKIQHDIIEILSENNHLFMVGDEDQSIYGFRAAYPQALLEFKQHYPNSTIIRMETNYRSTPQIISKAQQFISNNKNRYIKNMKSDKSSGSEVKVIKVNNRAHQYAYLMKILDNTKDDIAILYRENDSAVPIVDRLLRKNISFCMVGSKSDVFGVPCIRDVLAYLKLSVDPYDVESFSRICNKGYFYCKKQIKEQIISVCKQKQLTIFEVLDKLEKMQVLSSRMIHTFHTFMNQIGNENAFKAICHIAGGKYKNYAKDNSIDLSKIETIKFIAEKENNVHSFLLRIECLKEVMMKGIWDKNANIILSTVHASKGKEYDTVYLIDIYDGRFPTTDKDSVFSALSDEDQKQEERRLFYVAMTRAKNELNIFRMTTKKSEFIEELFPPQKQNQAKRKKIKIDYHDYQIRKNSIINEIDQQEKPVIDASGIRWFRCSICGSVKPRESFVSYGGMNHMNLGVCYKCRNKGKG